MMLSDVAPRLARARDQVVETEHVLGWFRDNSWTGGVAVLVPVLNYLPRSGKEVVDIHIWVDVDRVVQGDAAPYPIRGRFGWGISGQWAMHEVAGIKLLCEDYPELVHMHPGMPAHVEAVFE